MSISEISMISEFEAGMNCLQNPSLLSRSFSFCSADKVPQIYSVWKWGALILALVATLIGILIKRMKLVFIRFRRLKALASSEHLKSQVDDDYDSSDDDDDTCSSVSSADEGYESTSSFEDRETIDEDFCVAGSSYYGNGQLQNSDPRIRRCRSGGDCLWSDFTTGKSVVKLWESLRLGLESEDTSGVVISAWNWNQVEKVSSVFGGICQIQATSLSCPAVFLSAEVNNSNNFALGVYDTRIGHQIPAIFAEWWPKQGKVIGVKSCGFEKVYVEDEATGALTVGDMRNVKTPLEMLTESDRDKWWDADTGIVPDEFVDDFSR